MTGTHAEHRKTIASERRFSASSSGSQSPHMFRSAYTHALDHAWDPGLGIRDPGPRDSGREPKAQSREPRAHVDQLKAVLTYHVVPGRLDSKMLMEKAHAGGGHAELKTVSGDTLWVAWKDGRLWLRDGKGMTAAITRADVYQSNGVIHVIDTVVMAN